MSPTWGGDLESPETVQYTYTYIKGEKNKMTENYKPQTLVSNFESIQGEALIQVKKDAQKARVIFRDKEVCATPVVLKLEECPEEIREGKYIVSISKDKTQMFALRPINGMYEVKVEKFSSPEGKPPTPKTHQKWDYQYFTVVLKVANGKEKGLRIPYTLRYHFGEVTSEEGKSVVAYNHARSKYTQPLDEFLTATGAWDAGEMKYEDNILPMLEKRILRADKTIKVVIKDGWVTTVYGNESMPDEEDADDTEETNSDWE